MTIFVKTKTCIAFKLVELPDRNGGPSTFTLAEVLVEPFPGSSSYIIVDSWLVGATVSGVTVSKQGWHVAIKVADLAVKTRGATVPITTVGLAKILQAQLGPAFQAGIRKGTLQPGAVEPVVSAAGFSTGTAFVISAGPGTTPVMTNTQEQQDLEDARAALSPSK